MIANSNDETNFPYKLLLTNRQVANLHKERNGGFLSMLLGTLGASLLRDMLAGKGFTRAGYGSEQSEKGKEL